MMWEIHLVEAGNAYTEPDEWVPIGKWEWAVHANRIMDGICAKELNTVILVLRDGNILTIVRRNENGVDISEKIPIGRR